MGEKLYGVKSATDKTIPTIEKATKAVKGLSDAQKAVINANIKLQDSIVNNLQSSLSVAENSLSAVTNKFEDLNSTISSSVTDVIDFGKAIETENFIDAITKQAQDATSFADKVKQLIVMGLSERGIRELLDAGFDAGSLIADQLIAGGATVVQQINTLLDSVNVVAETVGRLGAETFYQQGVDQGNALVDGIKASLASAQAELDRLRESLTAPVTIAPTTGANIGSELPKPKPKPKPAPVPPPPTKPKPFDFGFRANGGPVTSGLPFIVGERGPELFIPNTSGSITPNNQMTNGNSVFNITVNAGVGTNGAQVGQQIVEAIKKYERTSGQVFARA
jgi:hypothetical protein